MILIFKKINSATIVSDIEEFIAPVLAGGLFKRSGKIENIKIQMLEVTGSNHVEYNALVNVEPDTVAERVIQKLNRKPINGKYINISEFEFRHRDNDRRSNRYKQLNDRRRSDRRRANLQVKDITDQRRIPLDQHRNIGWSTDLTL